jgi:2-polyprenyl-3-methyl-5-hydroxy-6-metoxy-1,4-benzoquinol methylase
MHEELDRFVSIYSSEFQSLHHRKLKQYRYRVMCPFFLNGRCLDLGCGDGTITQWLANAFEDLTVVDGSQQLLDRLSPFPNLTKIHGYFEDLPKLLPPNKLYNTIILSHSLEHIEKPRDVLNDIKTFLDGNGRVIIVVPNGNSLHRQLGVKMGLLKYRCELHGPERAVGHKKVYTLDALKSELQDVGFSVVASGGFFLKTLSAKQMDESWTEEMMDGFYELGKDYPEMDAEIFAICELR